MLYEISIVGEHIHRFDAFSGARDRIYQYLCCKIGDLNTCSVKFRKKFGKPGAGRKYYN